MKRLVKVVIMTSTKDMSMLDSGRMTYHKELESKNLQITLIMKANLETEKNRDRVDMFLKQEFIREIFKMDALMAKELLSMLTIGSILETGKMDS